MRAVSLKDQNGTEYGQQLYLLRYDNMKNEEVLIVTTGRNPSIDYRSVYADKHLFGKETKADRDYAVDNGLAAMVEERCSEGYEQILPRCLPLKLIFTLQGLPKIVKYCYTRCKEVIVVWIRMSNNFKK